MGRFDYSLWSDVVNINSVTDTGCIKLNTMQLVFAASPLSTQHKVVKAQTGVAWNRYKVSRVERHVYPRTFVSVSYH